MSDVQGGPHEFSPLKRFRNRGRCRHCFMPESFHPINGWTPARALGDKRMPLHPAKAFVRFGPPS